MLQELEEERAKPQSGSLAMQRDGEYATTTVTQLRHVAKRTLLNSIRNPATTIVQVSASTATHLSNK